MSNIQKKLIFNKEASTVGSKPGGGGKMQAYVPKGNGEKSGQYVSTHKTLHYVRPDHKKETSAKKYSDEWPNRGGKRIINEQGKYNFANARIKKVVTVNELRGHISLKGLGVPNSVTKKIVAGCVVTERYYDEKGEAYLDIDYSNHGDARSHPKVPHLHSLRLDKDGKLLIRTKMEDE